MSDEQRSDQWFKERLGCVTSSSIDAVLAKPKKGSDEATTRKNLKARLVCEILTGKRQEEYTSWDMQRGIQLEPLAVGEYETRKHAETETVGFVPHPTIGRAGASPDRLIGPNGILEVKCPKLATHLDYLREKIVPVEYRKQMLWELACTGRRWADFVSYHPDAPEHLQLFCVRLLRDDILIKEIEAEVLRFLDEVDELMESLPKPDDPLEITDDDLVPALEASIKQAAEAKKL